MPDATERTSAGGLLAGKVVLITGAASGIGRATCLLARDEDARGIVATDRDDLPGEANGALGERDAVVGVVDELAETREEDARHGEITAGEDGDDARCLPRLADIDTGDPRVRGG